MRDEGNEAGNGERELLLSDQAMAQLFRGELSRSDLWRSRLDTTTNWALTTTAAVVSFGFANVNASHVVFIVGIWMVLSFLLIEARRYRYYDLWIRRVRLLEDGYWAPMLRREPVDPDAMRELASEIERPQIHLSLAAALSTRIKRAYGPILMVLVLAWSVKLYSDPRPAGAVREMVQRAHVGFVAGPVVVALVVLLVLAVAWLFVSSYFVRAPLGELRTRPRGRRAALWEGFYRPYAPLSPRRRARRPERAAPPVLPEEQPPERAQPPSSQAG
jgi:uncharacterized membrane protein